MRRLLAAALAAVLIARPAWAETEGSVAAGTAAQRSSLIGCYKPGSAPAPATGQQMAVSCDAAGNVMTSVAASAATLNVQGPTVDSQTAGINPVTTGCEYLSTQPTYVTTNIATCQLTNRGELKVAISNGASSATTLQAADTASSQIGLSTFSQGEIYNGATWDRIRAVANGTNSTGTGLLYTGEGAQCDDASVAALTENSFGQLREGCTDHSLLIGGSNAGVTTALTADSSGRLTVNGNGTFTVAGTAADAATASGNPVQIGGTYLTTVPTYTNGQQAAFHTDTRGNLNITLCGVNGTTCSAAASSAQGDAYSQASAADVTPFARVYNGTNWDRMRGDTVSTWTSETATTNSAVAITSVVSTAAEGSHIIKASAGNLYGWTVTSGASAGYVMVFNATSAPGDGAVTPAECVVIAANATVSGNYLPPTRFTTGITIVFSTTGCFTKTISATAFISGKAS